MATLDAELAFKIETADGGVDEVAVLATAEAFSLVTTAALACVATINPAAMLAAATIRFNPPTQTPNAMP
jgi:hypothetical protein